MIAEIRKRIIPPEESEQKLAGGVNRASRCYF
jgi:hypothetical protein